MWNVIIETYVNGKREMDGIYPKIYFKRGFAVRKAVENSYTFRSINGDIIEKDGYIRKYLKPVDYITAKETYCNGYDVYIDGKYGKDLLPRCWEYSSHADPSELFHRSIEQMGGYEYDGNYYIAYDL